jgi:hypothetical protein
MPCRVLAEGRQHNGIVLDFSASGLFIQTSARLSPGARVEIDLGLPDGTAHLQIEVVRRKQVPPQLLTVAHGGLGVRILTAPEAYYRFLQEVQERDRLEQAATGSAPQGSPADRRTGSPADRKTTPAAAPPAKPASKPADPPPNSPRFRVRVSQISGARSRIVAVSARSAEEASRAALAELGDGWKVLQVEPA